MIDFTNCPVNKFRAYGGANGNKIHVRYQGHGYMLKFPTRSRRSTDMSYTNSCISEYLACHVFAALGFTVQETLLGTYTDKRGREKRVVACRDFTEDGRKLIEFAQLKNTCIDSAQNGYVTELSSILAAIEEQTLLPADELRNFFWDMFIADALLGNFHRHNGNWGLLLDEREQTAEIAPVYDCDSCLYPQLAPEEMAMVLHSEAEIDQRVYGFPNSAILEDGKKISYFDFISSLKDPGCTAALERVSPHIDMDGIERILAETPELTELQREFYLTMIQARKEKIIDYSMAALEEQRRTRAESPELSL